MGNDTFHYTRLLRVPPNLVLNTARAATSSLGSLCQCLTTLTVKNFFIMPNLNLPSFIRKLFPLVLSLSALRVTLPFLKSPLKLLQGCVEVFPDLMLCVTCHSPSLLSCYCAKTSVDSHRDKTTSGPGSSLLLWQQNTSTAQWKKRGKQIEIILFQVFLFLL